VRDAEENDVTIINAKQGLDSPIDNSLTEKRLDGGLGGNTDSQFNLGG
jgi:hypothetical protein